MKDIHVKLVLRVIGKGIRVRRLRRMEFWKIIHGEWSGKLVMKLKRIIWRDARIWGNPLSDGEIDWDRREAFEAVGRC